MNEYKYEQSLPHWSGGIHYDGPTIEAIQKYPQYLTGAVLDLGCSSGYHLYVTAENPLVTRAVGIDVNQTKITHAETLRRPTDTKVEFVCGNMVKLGHYFGEDEFDSIETFHTLEHLFPDDLPEFFEQIKRVLKPDGHLMIIIPLDHNHDTPNEHHSWWSSTELTALFESHGFEVEFCDDYISGQILGVFKNKK